MFEEDFFVAWEDVSAICEGREDFFPGLSGWSDIWSYQPSGRFKARPTYPRKLSAEQLDHIDLGDAQLYTSTFVGLHDLAAGPISTGHILLVF